MNGVLVLDKPAGPTSFDAVQRVRRALKVKKAGHTGTLDPMATGVLHICVGEATRIAQFITEGDKSYDAVLQLGAETDTLDAQGQVKATQAIDPGLNRAAIEAALAPFRGSFLQTPPMYSAVKVGGQRLYELARAGEEIERAARQVNVTRLELIDFSADTISLSMTSSKGFFVRVLAQEVGRALGCLAHLKALRRTGSGQFSLAQAVPLAQLLEQGSGTARLLTEEEALADLPALTVSAEEALRVRHGGLVEATAGPGVRRVLAPDGTLLAIAEVDRGKLRYRRVLADGRP
jgi:tRNA pseudouridine55 synthase